MLQDIAKAGGTGECDVGAFPFDYCVGDERRRMGQAVCYRRIGGLAASSAASPSSIAIDGSAGVVKRFDVTMLPLD